MLITSLVVSLPPIWEAPNPRTFSFLGGRHEGSYFCIGAPIKPDLFEHIDGLRSCEKAYVEHYKKQK